MIYQNVEFHNIDAIHEAEGGGVKLQRIPDHVRDNINESAQLQVLRLASSEIRFIADGPSVKIKLSSEVNTDFEIFHGTFQSPTRIRVTEEPEVFEITLDARVSKLAESHTEGLAFSPKIIRLLMGGEHQGQITFHSIEGKGIAPPPKEMLPKLRYLAYGTSITHGAFASRAHLTYVEQAARHLGADVINLGVAGSAQCENVWADYIAGRDDWDIATLAMSVNMMGARFTLEEFYNRVHYMAKTIAESNPERQVLCITIFPHFREFDGTFEIKNVHGTCEEYREALRKAVKEADCKNLHLIEGPEILQEIDGLAIDLLHPSDWGMMKMGERLAAKMKQILKIK
ncbi:MAG: SGNH/GDSL hydrolase family protein [Planctomycetota bacterium]|jgi:lysophospholipase L1-like esterase